MSRAKSRTSDLSKDVSQYWAERGFRPDLVTATPSPGEDSKGEEAYQRAFMEAARSKPPRLPNPLHYPNSVSAQEYIRRKNQSSLVAESQRSSVKENLVHQRQRTTRDPDRSPMISGRLSSSTSPASSSGRNVAMPPPPPSLPSMAAQFPDNAYASPSPYPSFNLQPKDSGRYLSALEPFGAPSGPVNKLR